MRANGGQRSPTLKAAWRQRGRRLAAVLGVALGLTCAGLSPAWAQLARWPAAGSPPSAGANKTPSLEERTAAVEQRLRQLQRQAAEALQRRIGDALPPGVRAAEWAEYEQLLRATEVQYLKHLDALRALDQLRRQQALRGREAGRGADLSQPPPYPIDVVDGLWEQVRTKEQEIGQLRVDDDLLGKLIEERRDALKEAGRALWQEAERATGDDTSAAGLRRNWLRELGELRLRHAEAVLGALESERERNGAARARLLEERDQLRRRAVVAQRRSPLSEADRDAKLVVLAAEERALRSDTEAAASAERSARAALDQTAGRLAEARRRGEGAESDGALGALEEEFDSREVEAEVAASNLKLLRLLALGNAVSRQMWEQRYRLGQAGTPAASAKAMDDAELMLARVRQFRAYMMAERDHMQRRLEAEEQRQAGLAGEARSHAERRVRAYADGETVLRRALRDTDAVEALLGNWLESLRLQREAASVADRLRLLYAELGAFAGGLWNFELMAVEDKIVVEGREIVGKRSVTVGQVGQVVLILVIGLWLTGRIAGRGRRLLFRRYQGRESTALLIHRLFSLLAGSALVLFALGTVNIPLTVFAFVGGALALGVGFGAQNILNNFISGLILLVERPIKVGDIVEVEGVRGAVTTIGSRCCHVRRFDGIDMLIPNSSFLEKNVTNWTLSDQRLRFTVTCRVAYGSVVHHVMALLRRAVDEHPRVQREPMPEVFVEQFGDSALEFRLDFWLDISHEPNWQRVMSEVRVRIDELFREAGMAFAFPQRDVHVDLVAPVRVDWAGPAAEPRP